MARTNSAAPALTRWLPVQPRCVHRIAATTGPSEKPILQENVYRPTELLRLRCFFSPTTFMNTWKGAKNNAMPTPSPAIKAYMTFVLEVIENAMDRPIVITHDAIINAAALRLVTTRPSRNEETM
jgi:hypothetical protein